LEKDRPCLVLERAFGLAAALWFAASAAWAGPVPAPRLVVGEGGTLHAGSRVRVAWDALPADTEEFELLLKIERPAPLKIRLTESEDPALASLSWQVPNLPCTGARLVLRRGDGENETTWAVSAPFVIAAPGLSTLRAPDERMTFRGDELWLETASDSRRAGLEEDHRLARGAPLSSLPAGALTDSKEFAAGASSGSSVHRTTHRSVTTPPPHGGRGRTPLKLQLRI